MPLPNLYPTFRAFLTCERGSETVEFALVFLVCTVVALAGWSALATTASTRQNTMQTNLSNSSINPP